MRYLEGAAAAMQTRQWISNQHLLRTQLDAQQLALLTLLMSHSGQPQGRLLSDEFSMHPR